MYFILSFQVLVFQDFFFFWAILDFLHFHMNFRISLPSYTKMPSGILIEIVLNLLINLGSITIWDHVTLLNLIVLKGFFCRCLRNFCIQDCYLQREFCFYFPIQMPFIYFSCLNALARTFSTC